MRAPVGSWTLRRCWLLSHHAGARNSCSLCRGCARSTVCPERCFVRVPAERKPVYVDFANLFAVEQLTTLLRDEPTSTFTEVLPAPGQWWLHGPGTRSNEWRLTAMYLPDGAARDRRA